MKISVLSKDFISIKRGVGYKYRAENQHLNQFSTRIKDIDSSELTKKMIIDYIHDSPTTSTKIHKANTLRMFIKWINDNGYPCPVKTVNIRLKNDSKFVPYIYSKEEVKEILARAKSNQYKNLSSETVYLILLVMYATGMRLGEVLHLKRSDVDFEQNEFNVEFTKFNKSRLVPFGINLRNALLQYNSKCMDAADNHYFFVTRLGQEIKIYHMEHAFDYRIRPFIHFRKDFHAAPRMHDLRHTFVMRRLISWYQDGVDLNDALPLLSTYIGHLDLDGTKRYITMTPELLREANTKFEKFIGE